MARRKLFILAALVSGIAAPARAYTSNDTFTAFSSYTNVFYVVSGTNSWFRNLQSGGNGATYFWGQANEIECVIDAYEVTTNSIYKRMVTNLLNGFKFNNGSSWSYNPYNDDVMWACMAFARGYLDTGITNFRDVAKSNFDMCYARGWDTNAGGMFWTVGNTNKVAAVNGPASIAAHLLYQIYNDTSYLAKATNIYSWLRSNLFVSATGMIYDGMHVGGPPSGGATTYNQGTFIGAANFLGQTNDALLAANYTMNSMTSSGILPQYGTNNNNSGFNAIFVRWLTKFMRDKGLTGPYQQWLQDNGNAAWNFRRTTDNLSWCQWRTQTPSGVNLYSWDCISSFEILLTVPPTQSSSPETVILTADDAGGSSSFTSAGGWSDPNPPSAANNYVVNGLDLRTPADSVYHTFAGGMLLLTNGGALRMVTSGGAIITVGTTLTMDNGIVSATVRPAVLNGRITLQTNGGVFDPQSLGTFTVNAPIDGPGALIVASDNNTFSGTVILNGANSYSGGTIINGPDTLQLTNSSSLGATNGGLTFLNSGIGLTIPHAAYTSTTYGTLNLNGTDVAIGNLSGGGGRIVNNEAGGVATLTIGSGSNGGGVYFGIILDHTANAGVIALVKSGNGTITLAGTNAYTGGTTIVGGTLQIGDGISTNGGIVGDITNNASLVFATPSAVLYADQIRGTGSLLKTGAGTLVLADTNTFGGGTTVAAGTLQLGDAATRNGFVPGGITNNSTLVFGNPLAQTLTNIIRGTGSATKIAGGTLTLIATNTYSGNTTVSAGTLAFAGFGSISNSSVIAVSAGATLDVLGRNDQTLFIKTLQTLTGSGGVNGKVSLLPGSTLNPGDAIGTFTVQSNMSLAGLARFELNRTNTQACDRVVCNGVLSGGGNLLVTNPGPALVAGDTFTLFNQPVSGFSQVMLPPLDSSLAWTNKLAIDGTLQVLSTVATTSTNIGSQTLNGGILLSWPADHIGWRLQNQTNAAGLGTNWVDIPGSTATNQIWIGINPTNSPVFFRLLFP
jgi:autotransporter-associated beta strand protein